MGSRTQKGNIAIDPQLDLYCDDKTYYGLHNLVEEDKHLSVHKKSKQSANAWAVRE